MSESCDLLVGWVDDFGGWLIGLMSLVVSWFVGCLALMGVD